VYLVVLLAESYFGSSNFGAPTNDIPYPWDLVVVIVVALGFYYWGVASGIKTDMADEAVQSWQVGGQNFTA
jgi:hypothetical protein